MNRVAKSKCQGVEIKAGDVFEGLFKVEKGLSGVGATKTKLCLELSSPGSIANLMARCGIEAGTVVVDEPLSHKCGMATGKKPKPCRK
jgi:hypothetical protein